MTEIYSLPFYYLQSRFYDQEAGRFLNADEAVSNVGEEIVGNNLYAYCFNNLLFILTAQALGQNGSRKLLIVLNSFSMTQLIL